VQNAAVEDLALPQLLTLGAGQRALIGRIDPLLTDNGYLGVDDVLSMCR
jgi:hypothetical protein